MLLWRHCLALRRPSLQSHCDLEISWVPLRLVWMPSCPSTLVKGQSSTQWHMTLGTVSCWPLNCHWRSVIIGRRGQLFHLHKNFEYMKTAKQLNWSCTLTVSVSRYARDQTLRTLKHIPRIDLPLRTVQAMSHSSGRSPTHCQIMSLKTTTMW